MGTIIRWAVRNSPAVNTVLVAVLVVGTFAFFNLRRETFPNFDIDMVLASVPYPGASPTEVEEGICLKIEEAVRSIDGIKKVTSVATEGMGYCICELSTSVKDPQRVLNEIRSAVDRIPSFPEAAEDPDVRQVTIHTPAIRLTLTSDQPVPANPERRTVQEEEAEWELRGLAEQLRDELQRLPTVSQVEILNARAYQIDVELPEDTLRKHGLTLQAVAESIRRENLEMPAGTIRTQGNEFLVRGRNKGLVGAQIARLPVLTQPNGVVLTVGDLGNVRDGFEDTAMYSAFNGKQSLSLEVSKTADEDLLKIVDEVKAYVASRVGSLPPGYEITLWNDQSEVVRDRLNLLTEDGLVGLALVFIFLALFLNIRLAFWVALGIPVSVLGAAAIMYFAGDTMNMISMFALLMGLGIVVDDAIVIGENIYQHRRRGKSAIQAAIDGTTEVATSVVSSVAVTITAFVPLAFVSGMMGKFIACMPLAAISMLVVCMIESLVSLPCHLAHAPDRLIDGNSNRRNWHERLQGRFMGLMDWFVEDIYTPILRRCLKYPTLVYSLAAATLLVTTGLILGGLVPLEVFPKLDGNLLRCRLVFPDGTPVGVTDQAARLVEAKIREVSKELTGSENGVVKFVHRAVGSRSQVSADRAAEGSNLAEIWVELLHVEHRQELSHQIGKSLKSTDIVARWRQAVGEIPGIEELSFGEAEMGPGAKPIEFKVIGQELTALKEAADMAVAELRSKRGVFDVSHDNRVGKWELQLKIRPEAEAMGVQLADLARTVRATYYGDEVMRLQRGRHEIKLMVRYPPQERRSLANFEEIRIRTGQGHEIPLPVLAQVDRQRAYWEINRVNGQRSITVTADVNTDEANAHEIVNDLKANFVPRLRHTFGERGQSINVLWEGQRQMLDEAVSSMLIGFAIALLAMVVMLTLEFRSYLQPLIIVSIIPFGLTGAVLGHLVMGLSVSMFSLFGMVALTGVVVNDSIVLMDFINRRRDQGVRLVQAIVDSGPARFRPVLLNSITSIVGVLPIVLERSLQAQVLVPMGVCLSFGLAASTFWVLILLPVQYQTYARWFQGPAAPELPEPQAKSKLRELEPAGVA